MLSRNSMIKSHIFLDGDVAQTVERSLCMREARGSIPRISNFFIVSTKHDVSFFIQNL